MVRPIWLLETLHNDPSPMLNVQQSKIKQTGKRHKLVDEDGTLGFD